MNIVKPNSPESFAICYRICNEDRKRRGLPPKKQEVPKMKRERKHKPVNEWKPRVKITDDIIQLVCKLIKEEKTNKEIVDETGVSIATVSRIKRKLRNGVIERN